MSSIVHRNRWYIETESRSEIIQWNQCCNCKTVAISCHLQSVKGYLVCFSFTPNLLPAIITIKDLNKIISLKQTRHSISGFFIFHVIFLPQLPSVQHFGPSVVELNVVLPAIITFTAQILKCNRKKTSLPWIGAGKMRSEKTEVYPDCWDFLLEDF